MAVNVFSPVICTNDLVADVVGVVADRVRNLLQDEDQPDRGEHAADHATTGSNTPTMPTAQRRERQLNAAGQDHRGQERGVRTERGDRREHDGGQAGRRAADHQLRSAQRADDDAADDAGDDARRTAARPRRRRCPGRAARRRGRRPPPQARRRASGGLVGRAIDSARGSSCRDERVRSLQNSFGPEHENLVILQNRLSLRQ